MEEHDELSDYAHMWDGRETWVLQEFHCHEAGLTVVFAGPSLTVAELAALRSASEAFRDLPAAQLKTELAGKTEVKLGRFRGLEAREAEERVRILAPSLQLRVEARSYTSYLPLQLAENGQWMMCIIEDDALSKQVTARMIEYGVPVEMTVEVD